MNKNKGIWLVIAAILLIGIAVTFATSRFIRQNGGSLDTVAVTQMPVTAGGGIPQAYSEGAGAETPAAAKKRMAAAPIEEEDAAPGNTGEAADQAQFRNLRPPGSWRQKGRRRRLLNHF